MRLMPQLVAEITILPLGECIPDENLFDIWRALEVSDDLARALVDLRLFFVEGRLQASVDIVGQDKFAEKTMWCLASLWRFTKFFESRWISVCLLYTSDAADE